ncbi:MAG TPA: response regulator [Gemmatimonadales bacterium]|nr:response regulator [Gemmatimonadales bacterium]
MPRIEASPLERHRAASAVSERDAAKRCLVAIIEDDTEFRNMLRELLEEEQYRVVAVSNGAEALETLRGNTVPNVILLDVSMPVMDGFDFLRIRNDDPRLAQVPVVLVTNAKPHERPTVGVNDVVRKPIDIDEILFAIKRYCD